MEIGEYKTMRNIIKLKLKQISTSNQICMRGMGCTHKILKIL